MVTQLKTKTQLATLLAGLIAGTEKHSSSGPLTLEGQSFTPQALIAALQSLVDALAKIDAAGATWHDTIEQASQVRATIRPLAGAYRNYLLLAYRNTPAVLADYGLAPRKKRAPLTTEQQAAAVAKRKSTRTARHTMGPKQKAGVKGDVTGVVVTPITEPKPPTPSPSPVPAPAPVVTPTTAQPSASPTNAAPVVSSH